MAAGMGGGVNGPPPGSVGTPKPPKTGEDVSHSPGGIRPRQMKAGFGGYKKGSVKAQQAFLTAKGFYHGSIDGIRGPQTRAAISAFKGSRGKGSQPPKNPKSPSGPKRPRSPATPRGGGGGGHGGGGKAGGMVKPRQYANSLIKAQYGPLLKQLRYQRDLANSQSQQNIADIGSYYNQVDSKLAGLLTGSDQHAQQVQSQHNGDLQSLLASLGGSASQGAAPASSFAALMQGALSGQANAEHGYLTDQQALTGQARNQAVVDQQRLQQQNESGIDNQINSQLASRAADYKVALSDAQQLRLQQLAAKQNMAIAAGEFNMNQALGAGQVRNQNLQNRGLKQQLKGGGNNFGALTANDKSKMIGGVNTVMYNPQDGEARLKPNQAWVKAANHLRSLGYNVAHSVKARKFLASVWGNYVKDYNAAHPGAPWKGVQPNGTPFTDKEWANA